MAELRKRGPQVGRSDQFRTSKVSVRSNADSYLGSLYASTILSMDNDDDLAQEKVQTLNDQQWVLQRKKIGLSRRTKRSLTKVNNFKDRKKTVLEFITTNFSRRECCHFVADESRKTRPLAASPGPSSNGPCFCGAPIDEHLPRTVHLKASSKPNPFETIKEEEESDSTTDSVVPIIKVEEKPIPPLPGSTESPKGLLKVQKAQPFVVFSSPEVSNSQEVPSLRDNISRPQSALSRATEMATGSGQMTSVETTSSLKMEKGDPHSHLRDAPILAEATPTHSYKETGEWNESLAIQDFPTNAYGQIEFINEDEGSLKPSKYIRLSDKTPMHVVKELLTDYWGIYEPHRPHLALSLIGGAKNFRMEGRKKETFKRGLIGAAKSTNALILTGGTNTGTMKLVGDAIREGQFMVQNGDKLSRGLKLMGLCSFGYIKDRELLINDNPNEFNYVRYNSNQEIKKGDNVPLNGDHTHFIMVDDGSRYRFFSGYTNFITKFETMIRDPEPQGLGIPIVTLLLEGGKDAIRIVKDRLKEGIACVVIEGSGRAADIISYAYRNAVKNPKTNTYTMKEGHIAHLMKMLETAYGTYIKPKSARDEQMKDIMNWTIECISHSDIITIFDIRRETQLDTKILSALLKSDNMSLHQQLFFAMIWDRIDLAEEKILVKDTLNTMDSLHEIMLQALVLERTNFIELLVMNGFVMRTFLTVERLRRLYNESTIRWRELHFQMKNLVGIPCNEIYLRNVHKLLVTLLKDHDHSLYQLDRPPKSGKKHRHVDVSTRTFEEPYVELFLWAIFTNKQSLIDFCWKRCGQPMLMAIVAGAIYSKMGNFYRRYNKDIKILTDRKAQFQRRANMLMEIAYEADPNKSYSLLEKRNKRWGGRNFMQLGYIGHLRTFIANPTCQSVVNSNWIRGFLKLPWFSCLLCLILPFLTWTPIVTFMGGLGDDGGKLTWFQKLYVFYRAPVVKYTGTCISFLALITLYSYVALYGYRNDFQMAELILYTWVAILIVDECREVIMEPSKKLSGKLSDHMDSVWNKFDFIIYGIMVINIVLKMFPATFEVSRVVFAGNCSFFYIRVFRIYHASRSLGPKLVIFHRMIPEIVTFMFLLIVFILAYGVANQAIIDPYRQFDWTGFWKLLFQIVFLPYWQMYGELSLESIEVRDTPVCPRNGSAYEPTDKFPHCYPEDIENISDYNYVTPAFLAIYLLIGNVMLLNLLIAIFTAVFEEVHENSNDVWKWEMYRLVEEYDKKPGLAPPLVLFEDIWKLLKGIWKQTCRKRKENLDSYMQEALETLRLFERDCMSAFQGRMSKNSAESLDQRIKVLEMKTDQLLELFEEAPDDQANWGEVIDMDKKLYETDSSSDSDDDVEKELSKKRKQNRPKRKSLRMNVVESDPKTARIQTARSSQISRRLQVDIANVKEQLEAMQENRKAEIEQMHRVQTAQNERLEKMIAQLLNVKIN